MNECNSGAAEQIEDAPQSPAEVVETVTLVPHESEVVAGGVSERHRLVTLGVCFRMWTWSNTTIAIARRRRKRGRGLACCRGCVNRVAVDSSTHRQSCTGGVAVTATCATSPLSQITLKTKMS